MQHPLCAIRLKENRESTCGHDGAVFILSYTCVSSGVSYGTVVCGADKAKRLFISTQPEREGLTGVAEDPALVALCAGRDLNESIINIITLHFHAALG